MVNFVTHGTYMVTQTSDGETSYMASYVADGYDGLFCHTLSVLAWAEWASRDSMTNTNVNP
jgi:hypothetical protein